MACFKVRYAINLDEGFSPEGKNLPVMPRTLGQALWKLEIGEEIWAPHMLSPIDPAKSVNCWYELTKKNGDNHVLKNQHGLCLHAFREELQESFRESLNPFSRERNLPDDSIGRINLIGIKKLIDGEKQVDFVEDDASEPGSEPGEPTDPDNASTVILGQSPKRRPTD